MDGKNCQSLSEVWLLTRTHEKAEWGFFLGRNVQSAGGVDSKQGRNCGNSGRGFKRRADELFHLVDKFLEV